MILDHIHCCLCGCYTDGREAAKTRQDMQVGAIEAVHHPVAFKASELTDSVLQVQIPEYFSASIQATTSLDIPANPNWEGQADERIVEHVTRPGQPKRWLLIHWSVCRVFIC